MSSTVEVENVLQNTAPQRPMPVEDASQDQTVANDINMQRPLSISSDDNDDENSRGNEIEYIYLNWNTEIATKPVFTNNDQADHYKPCPDLSQYDNPFEWSRTRKNIMTYVSCVTNGAAAYASGSYAAAEIQLTERWSISSVKFILGISVFTWGFGVAPMILAPFSEINGRRPVFIASGLLFVLCLLCCALTQSYAGMLLARFFAGCGGSTFSTMVGGILADIWVASERNTPMVLFTGATIFGTGLGPVVSGFLAENLLWRWVFYMQAILSGALVTLVVIFFRETRGPILLSRRAKMLNKWYEELETTGAIGVLVPESSQSSEMETQMSSPARVRRIRYKVLAEEQRASILKMISVSLYRPAHLLVTEPVVVCFSLWISFCWAVLYLQFNAIPLVFETNHNFDLQESGAVFAAVSLGGIISTWLSIYQDKWAVRRFGDKFTGTPEGRLWFTCAEALLMPVGMLMFGWTCYSSIHWIVPCIALVLVTMGIFSIFLATYNYCADVYVSYASSALAACGITRNLLGGAFPLVTVQMFTGMGFQAASSLLAGIGLLLSIGPIFLIWKGKTIRRKSKVARQFVEDGEL